jgi:DNA-binding MarR family transcriptional regulator
MSSIVPRRRQVTVIKESLRALTNQISLLNRHVGGKVELREVDLDTLDLIAREGPLGPTALARRSGLHPATLTGVLDRLQRAGWIARDRDPHDRRAVAVEALRDRGGELYRLYAPMNASLDEICNSYTDAELAVLADFLHRATEAGRTATDDLAH